MISNGAVRRDAIGISKYLQKHWNITVEASLDSWIIHFRPTAIAHPRKPELDGLLCSAYDQLPQTEMLQF